MFGLNMSGCRSWSIANYREALAFYESCPTRRGTEYGEERRISGKERSGQMGVRIVDGTVTFRYHHKDVVTWRADDAVTINTFPSKSTCVFADRFLPSDVSLTKTGSVVQVGEIYYPIDEQINVYKTREVEYCKGRPVFSQMCVDRKVSKKVLASTRYAEYRDWYKLMLPMLLGTMPPYWKRAYIDGAYLLTALANEDNWHEIMMSSCSDPNTVRAELYNFFSAMGEKVFYEKEMPSLASTQSLAKWRVKSK